MKSSINYFFEVEGEFLGEKFFVFVFGMLYKLVHPNIDFGMYDWLFSTVALLLLTNFLELKGSGSLFSSPDS